MVAMPDTDKPFHYLCCRCGNIFTSRAVLDRTREVIGTCCSTTGAWWNDEVTAARLGGITT